MVKILYRWIALSLILAIFSACTTIPSPKDAPPSDPVAQLPYTLSEDGLILVDVQINGSPPLHFVFDTGASRSVIGSRAQKSLDLPSAVGEDANVRGIFDQARRPLVSAKTLRIGDLVLTDTRMILLPASQLKPGVDGILGMDVMAQYIIAFDPDLQTLSFYTPDRFNQKDVAGWDLILLQEDPVSERKYQLHFATTYAGIHRIPTLIDTGAAFSVINWHAANLQDSMRRIRRRLREEWAAKGAIGSFKPRTAIFLTDLKIGAHSWDSPKLLILDLDSLSVLGADENPMMIAGANLFYNRRFVIDFPADNMFIDPRTGPNQFDEPRAGFRITTITRREENSLKR